MTRSPDTSVALATSSWGGGTVAVASPRSGRTTMPARSRSPIAGSPVQARSSTICTHSSPMRTSEKSTAHAYGKPGAAPGVDVGEGLASCGRTRPIISATASTSASEPHVSEPLDGYCSSSARFDASVACTITPSTPSVAVAAIEATSGPVRVRWRSSPRPVTRATPPNRPSRRPAADTSHEDTIATDTISTTIAAITRLPLPVVPPPESLRPLMSSPKPSRPSATPAIGRPGDAGREGRRPASALSSGVRATERAGHQAASVPAPTTSAAETKRSAGAMP